VSNETKPVIGIVDDDVSVRQALSGFVRSLGYAARTFDSGPCLLEAEDRASVSCLIADVQMPEMSGIDLHRALVEAGDAPPTILITAYGDAGLRERALQRGVSCYLTKPFSDDELLNGIRSALDTRGRLQDQPEDHTGSTN
jgi:FixJ family two-component response regulator